MTISIGNERLIVCECDTQAQAIEYIAVKQLSGWKVLIQPFPSRQDLVEIEDDVVRPMISEYTFLMHRF